MHTVAIKECQDYSKDQVMAVIESLLDQLEDIKPYLKEGKKALIKPNLLRRNKPEDSVTTHPYVVEAVAKYLMDRGVKVVIGDSPAGPLNKKLHEAIFKATGMEDVAKRLGCELFDDITYDEVTNENALMLHKMQVIKVVQEVDFVISVAKMKTHCMMTYSGAVKNLFGVIPGLIKAEYHFKLNDKNYFANHLVDICEYVKPLFSVLDAIDGMEGDGPSNGIKRHIGLLMASDSPYVLDSCAVSIAGISSSKVPTIVAAKERGLFVDNTEDLKFPFLNLEEARKPDFKLPNSMTVNFVGGSLPASIENWLVKLLKSKPEFNFDKCVSCGDCKRICPPQIITFDDKKKPHADLGKCISCFCCHEVCPHDAIKIKKHVLHKLMYR